jgi:hypothetical protein
MDINFKPEIYTAGFVSIPTAASKTDILLWLALVLTIFKNIMFLDIIQRPVFV